MERIERRKYQRVKTNNLVSIVSLDQTGLSTSQDMGTVLNLGFKGLLVETTRVISSKTVSIVTVDLANNLTEIQGEVVWSKEFSTGKVHSGISFHGSDLEMMNFCKALIKVFCRRKNSLTVAAESAQTSCSV